LSFLLTQELIIFLLPVNLLVFFFTSLMADCHSLMVVFLPLFKSKSPSFFPPTVLLMVSQAQRSLPSHPGLALLKGPFRDLGKFRPLCTLSLPLLPPHPYGNSFFSLLPFVINQGIPSYVIAAPLSFSQTATKVFSFRSLLALSLFFSRFPRPKKRLSLPLN